MGDKKRAQGSVKAKAQIYDALQSLDCFGFELMHVTRGINREGYSDVLRDASPEEAQRILTEQSLWVMRVFLDTPDTFFIWVGATLEVVLAQARQHIEATDAYTETQHETGRVVRQSVLGHGV